MCFIDAFPPERQLSDGFAGPSNARSESGGRRGAPLGQRALDGKGALALGAARWQRAALGSLALPTCARRGAAVARRADTWASGSPLGLGTSAANRCTNSSADIAGCVVPSRQAAWFQHNSRTSWPLAELRIRLQHLPARGAAPPWEPHAHPILAATCAGLWLLKPIDIGLAVSRRPGMLPAPAEWALEPRLGPCDRLPHELSLAGRLAETPPRRRQGGGIQCWATLSAFSCC